MAERRRIICSLFALGVALLVALIIAGCGTSSPTLSPSPRPAASVTALPGFTVGPEQQESAAGREVYTRVIMVFLKQRVTRAEVETMAQRIAAMPEVTAYHYVTPKETVVRFRQKFPHATVDAPVGVLPTSFEILVRERKDVVAVARRFFKDPLVDNAGVPLSGVSYISDESMQAVLSPSPSPSQ